MSSSRSDVPLPKKLGHIRFKESLRKAFDKLADWTRHDLLVDEEAWALRIVVNFAIAHVRETHEALGRLRQEICKASRASRQEAEIANVSAG